MTKSDEDLWHDLQFPHTVLQCMHLVWLIEIKSNVLKGLSDEMDLAFED